VIKKIGLYVVVFIAGVILAGIVFWTMMPKMMLTVNESKLGFEETVAAISESAIERGWLVPKIYDIQKSLYNKGYEDMTKVKIISLCHPHHAYSILRDDNNKKITAIMPCRIGIYETADGRVYISKMNTGLMSKMIGGTIAEVMGGVAKEEAEMIESIIKK